MVNDKQRESSISFSCGVDRKNKTRTSWIRTSVSYEKSTSLQNMPICESGTSNKTKESNLRGKVVKVDQHHLKLLTVCDDNCAPSRVFISTNELVCDLRLALGSLPMCWILQSGMRYHKINEYLKDSLKCIFETLNQEYQNTRILEKTPQPTLVSRWTSDNAKNELNHCRTKTNRN